MFTIPVIGFFVSLLWIPLLCMVCTFLVTRSARTIIYGPLVTAVAFVPGCIGTCFLIEPLFKWEGKSKASEVPDVNQDHGLHLKPPLPSGRHT